MELNYTGGLVPVIVQDQASREVLMLAWADEEAVRLTRETGYAHYWSRSRKRLWKRERKADIFRL